jgi:hypothetical protein
MSAFLALSDGPAALATSLLAGVLLPTVFALPQAAHRTRPTRKIDFMGNLRAADGSAQPGTYHQQSQVGTRAL